MADQGTSSSPGPFDDLIPAKAGPGPFDDLIPVKKGAGPFDDLVPKGFDDLLPKGARAPNLHTTAQADAVADNPSRGPARSAAAVTLARTAAAGAVRGLGNIPGIAAEAAGTLLHGVADAPSAEQVRGELAGTRKPGPLPDVGQRMSAAVRAPFNAAAAPIAPSAADAKSLGLLTPAADLAGQMIGAPVIGAAAGAASDALGMAGRATAEGAPPTDPNFVGYTRARMVPPESVPAAPEPLLLHPDAGSTPESGNTPAPTAPSAQGPTLVNAGSRTPTSDLAEQFSTQIDRYTFDHNGQKFGLDLGLTKPGWIARALHIEKVGPLDEQGRISTAPTAPSVNTLGPRVILDLARQLAAKYPDRDLLSGTRVTGAQTHNTGIGSVDLSRLRPPPSEGSAAPEPLLLHDAGNTPESGNTPAPAAPTDLPATENPFDMGAVSTEQERHKIADAAILASSQRRFGSQRVKPQQLRAALVDAPTNADVWNQLATALTDPKFPDQKSELVSHALRLAGYDTVTNSSAAPSTSAPPDEVQSLPQPSDAENGISTADGQSTVPAEEAEPEVRHSVGGLSPSAVAKLTDAWHSAFYGPAETIRAEHPEIASAAERVLAAQARAQHLSTTGMDWVEEGLPPESTQAFGRQGVLERLQDVEQKLVARIADGTAPREDAGKLAALRAAIGKRAQLIPPGYLNSADYRTQRANYRVYARQQLDRAGTESGIPESSFVDTPTGFVRLVGIGPNSHFADEAWQTGAQPNDPTSQSPSAKQATGLGDYSDDLRLMVHREAMDKFSRGAKNELLRTVLQDKNTRIVPSFKGDNLPEGFKRYAIDDEKGLLSDADPERELRGDSDLIPNRYRLHIPARVADALAHVRARMEPGPPALWERGLDHVSNALTQYAMAANYPAFISHAQTLAATVHAIPDQSLGAFPTLAHMAVSLLPHGTTADGLVQMLRYGMARAKGNTTTGRLLRSDEMAVARYGGLRPPTGIKGGEGNTASATKWLADHLAEALTSQGVPKKAAKIAANVVDTHEVLFGNHGLDVLSRGVAIQKYNAAYEKTTGLTVPRNPDDKRYGPYWSAVAKYTNQKAGNYVTRNAGAFVNLFQAHHASLFMRMTTARLGNAARLVVGHTGLPPDPNKGKEVLNRLHAAFLGLGGSAVGLTLLNRYFAHRSPLQNAPGHVADVAMKLGATGDVYARGYNTNPLLNTVVKALGIGDLAQGHPGEAARTLINTGLATVSSGRPVRTALAAADIKPYEGRQGGLEPAAEPALTRRAILWNRFKAISDAIRDVGAPEAGKPESNPGILEGHPIAKAVLGQTLGQVTSAAGSPERLAPLRTRQDVNELLTGTISKLHMQMGKPEEQGAIVSDALQQMIDSRLPYAEINAAQRELRHALLNANTGRDRTLGRFVTPGESPQSTRSLLQPGYDQAEKFISSLFHSGRP